MDSSGGAENADEKMDTGEEAPNPAPQKEQQVMRLFNIITVCIVPGPGGFLWVRIPGPF